MSVHESDIITRRVISTAIVNSTEHTVKEVDCRTEIAGNIVVGSVLYLPSRH